MTDVTLTITPSNQEDFMDSLARKIIERGMDQEMLVRLVNEVVDHVNFEDMSEQVLDNIDYDELRNEIVREMDYDDLTAEVVDKIDMYDLSRSVTEHLDADEIAYAVSLEEKVDELTRAAIAENIDNLEERVGNVETSLVKINEMLDILNTQISSIKANQNKSLLRRFFG